MVTNRMCFCIFLAFTVISSYLPRSMRGKHYLQEQRSPKLCFMMLGLQCYIWFNSAYLKLELSLLVCNWWSWAGTGEESLYDEYCTPRICVHHMDGSQLARYPYSKGVCKCARVRMFAHVHACVHSKPVFWIKICRCNQDMAESCWECLTCLL